MVGYLASDYVIVGDEIQKAYEKGDAGKIKNFIEKERVKFTFGCTIRETNLFKTQKADGIIGLGVNSNSLHFILIQHLLPTQISLIILFLLMKKTKESNWNFQFAWLKKVDL